MISVCCPQCQKKYGVKETAIGKNMTCKCGHVFAITEEPPEEDVSKGSGEGSTDGSVIDEKNFRRMARVPDLTNRKICSKCKAVMDLSIKECPKCGFNTMGIKYDQTRREAVTRDISIKTFNVLKYLIPVLLLLSAIFLFKNQISVLGELEELEDRVLKEVSNEKAKADLLKKDVSSTRSILMYEINKTDNVPYFLPKRKTNDTAPFSIFGNGYFTLRRPGVCVFVKYDNGRKENRYYYEDDEGQLLQLNPREYEFIKFESIAYKLMY